MREMGQTVKEWECNALIISPFLPLSLFFQNGLQHAAKLCFCSSYTPSKAAGDAILHPGQAILVVGKDDRFKVVKQTVRVN
jgi:hypothetical protein